MPSQHFSPAALDLLEGLLEKDPKKRLGCREHGIDVRAARDACASGRDSDVPCPRAHTQELKTHPFFSSIDWGLLEAGYVEPAFVPKAKEVSAPRSRQLHCASVQG